MTRVVEIPGTGTLRLDYLLLDVNGTITSRGVLLDGVAERLTELGRDLEVRLLSADTFAALESVGEALGARRQLVATGADKAAAVASLGPERCAAIGNGANDEAMLDAARLGIAVVGPEGAAGAAVRAADVVCGSILDALDLVLDERALIATLRA